EDRLTGDRYAVERLIDRYADPLAPAADEPEADALTRHDDRVVADVAHDAMAVRSVRDHRSADRIDCTPANRMRVPGAQSRRARVDQRGDRAADSGPNRALSVVLEVALQNQESFLVKVPAQPGKRESAAEDEGQLREENASRRLGPAGRVMEQPGRGMD